MAQSPSNWITLMCNNQVPHPFSPLQKLIHQLVFHLSQWCRFNWLSSGPTYNRKIWEADETDFNEIRHIILHHCRKKRSFGSNTATFCSCSMCMTLTDRGLKMKTNSRLQRKRRSREGASMSTNCQIALTMILDQDNKLSGIHTILTQVLFLSMFGITQTAWIQHLIHIYRNGRKSLFSLTPADSFLQHFLSGAAKESIESPGYIYIKKEVAYLIRAGQ